MSQPVLSDQPEFTPQERAVLRLLCQGRRNRDIAGVLGIAHSTVESHIHSILRKLGAANRTEAVVIAIQRRLLDDDNW